MFLKKKIGFCFLVVAMVFSNCSEYSRVVKSKDKELKYMKAKEYYAEGEYYKSLPLLEELLALESGTARNEELYFLFANTQYNLEDYYLASYYFTQFTKKFPNSEYCEECAYMSAICQTKVSPVYSLDQANTNKAIDELQLFLNKYPRTLRKDTCNRIIDGLRAKLELKSFEIAKHYHKTEKYKSALVALNNVLLDFPSSTYEEDIRFLILDASYELAKNSVESKKKERFEDTKKSYLNFAGVFPESEYISRAENMYKQTLRELEKL